jgi:hypothetical protein
VVLEFYSKSTKVIMQTIQENLKTFVESGYCSESAHNAAIKIAMNLLEQHLGSLPIVYRIHTTSDDVNCHFYTEQQGVMKLSFEGVFVLSYQNQQNVFSTWLWLFMDGSRVNLYKHRSSILYLNYLYANDTHYWQSFLNQDEFDEWESVKTPQKHLYSKLVRTTDY